VTQAISGLQARLRACRGVLVDSNVLLDVATNDPVWGDWSARALSQAAEYTTLIINPIIYAEVSIGYTTIEALEAVLPATLYQREALPWEAGFLAGKSFLLYRRRRGSRTSPLPDFYIGAHAAIGRLALLTRDAARYRSYFPRVEIFAPLSIHARAGHAQRLGNF
jgi:predicted nucleic acid-binding protein